MKECDIPKYLANIMAVARADGILSPQEEAAIGEICAEIRARKKDISRAESLVSNTDYKLTPVGRYSEQIRNIEDMIFTSLSDGKLEASERSVIVAFAKQIGIAQQQINRILSEAKSRAHAQGATIKCLKCKSAIPPGAKFCPECGSSIESNGETNGTKIDFEYHSQGISIEFAESSSSNFDAALSEARRAPDFQECLRSKKRWFLATWPRAQILSIVNLAESLKGIRNRKAYLDGKEFPWDELFGFVWCMQERQSAYKPAEYCFGADEKRLNLWGCKQIRMDWTEWANWFSYGSFRKKDVFVFDKERIKHELANNMHKYRFCPFLRNLLIETVFQLLPNEVRVSKRTGWKYKQNYEETPSSIRIVEKEKHNGFTTTREFYADGVVPIGFEVAREFLKRAFKACGVNDVDIRAIAP